VLSEGPRGNIGRIVVARRREDGLSVAIKVLLDEHAADAEFRARFRREAEVLDRLRHPHVLRLFEWGEVQGRMYMVTELLEGGDVAERLFAGGMPLADRKAILLQTLDALAACHAAGVIHRDVKPENLFLAWRDAPVVVKLGDFGIAKDLRAAEPLTHAGKVMMTEVYAAPEQRNDPRDVGPPADLHAFGVSAYEILSGGRLPIGDYARVSTLDPEVPLAVDAVIGRCLARRPSERWHSAADLKAALRGALGDDGDGGRA
jgi:serine/threonine-protein kinase